MVERKVKITEPWTYPKISFPINEILNEANEIAFNTFIDLVYLFDCDNLLI